MLGIARDLLWRVWEKIVARDTKKKDQKYPHTDPQNENRLIFEDGSYIECGSLGEMKDVIRGGKY